MGTGTELVAKAVGSWKVEAWGCVCPPLSYRMVITTLPVLLQAGEASGTPGPGKARCVWVAAKFRTLRAL